MRRWSHMKSSKQLVYGLGICIISDVFSVFLAAKWQTITRLRVQWPHPTPFCSPISTLTYSKFHRPVHMRFNDLFTHSLVQIKDLEMVSSTNFVWLIIRVNSSNFVDINQFCPMLMFNANLIFKWFRFTILKYWTIYECSIYLFIAL